MNEGIGSAGRVIIVSNRLPVALTLSWLFDVAPDRPVRRGLPQYLVELRLAGEA